MFGLNLGKAPLSSPVGSWTLNLLILGITFQIIGGKCPVRVALGGLCLGCLLKRRIVRPVSFIPNLDILFAGIERL